jgi:fructose-1,6-bisphosphatase/inositol monophosphatase family enzyme
MDSQQAYQMFGEMNRLALRELTEYTKKEIPIFREKSVDRDLVTGGDELLDKLLTGFANNRGIRVVSEEKEDDLEIVRSGNYLVIDPIDGSGNYLAHVQSAREKQLDTVLYDPSLGDNMDYCLLLALVENGKPRFGSYFSFVTEENILVDSESADHTIWDR